MEKLYVIADPILTGLHPLHENRYITTSRETEVYTKDGLCGDGETPSWEFRDHSGKVIATMTDCERQAEYARAFAASPELLDACMRVVARFSYLAKKEDAGHKINWREMGANGEIDFARSAIFRAMGRENFIAFALSLDTGTIGAKVH